MSFRFLATLLLAITLLPLPAQAGKRVALLVGNATYADAPLVNPSNDIRDVGRALNNLDFQVTSISNADQKRLQKAIREFGQAARGAEVALFYYSGHGIQSRGENYLIPVGANIQFESDIPDEAVAANSVMRWIEEATPKAAVVVLDACRDNPVAGRTKSLNKGLSRMDAPTGTLVAFATAPGTTASDEGLYAKALAKYLPQPGLDLQDIFAKVGAEVLQASRGKQRPRLDVGLYDKIYLAKLDTQAARTDTTTAATPVEPSAIALELAYWQGAQQTHSVQAYEDYLRQYPGGRFSGQAQAAIAKLKPESRPATTASLAPVPPPSYSSSVSTWDDPAILSAVRSGNFAWDSSIIIEAPDIAENGAVVPVDVSGNRTFKPGERLYIVVNDSFIGASLTPVDARAQLYLVTRIKMPSTGQLKAVLVDASGGLHVAAKEVMVKIGSDPNQSSGSPEFGPIKMRASNASNLDIKALFKSSQNPDLYIKTIGYSVDGTKIADVGLTPATSKHPYVAIRASGSGKQVEIQATASNGQSQQVSASVP